jgi:hypothetical protein
MVESVYVLTGKVGELKPKGPTVGKEKPGIAF